VLNLKKQGAVRRKIKKEGIRKNASPLRSYLLNSARTLVGKKTQG